MGWTGEVWQLRRGDELLGEITIREADFPWLYGTFTPQPGFAEVAPLFADELAAAESDDDAWEAAYQRVRSVVSLVAPRGPVPEFLLHIDGAEAWFRWSDEPFPDD